MPQDHNNLLTGLRVQSQIPLDVKNWIANETALSNLGIDNNLAFTYVKGMIIYCVQEGTRWEWKPFANGEKLLVQDFIYPPNVITFGINYSNQAYNFYKASSDIKSDWTSTSGPSEILNKPIFEQAPLKVITEGSNSGIVIRDISRLNYANIGFNAIDLSYSGTASTTLGASGSFSFAANREVIASGYGASAFGNSTVASAQLAFVTGSGCVSSGTASFTGGEQCVASREWTFSFGASNVSSGIAAVSFGNSNFARSAAEISIGHFGTDYTPANVIGFNLADRAFNVGIGLDSLNRKNGFTILKNGLGFLPTSTVSLINSDLTGKAIVTKEYLSTITSNAADGSETKINPGSNITISGTGTTISPYIINSTASAGSAQGLQATIITNPLINTEAVVELEYASSITFKGKTSSNLVSPYLRLDTEVTMSSGDYPIAEIGITNSTGGFMEKGFQISGQSFSIDIVNPSGYGIVDYNLNFNNLSDYTLINKKYSDTNFQKTVTTNYTLDYLDNNYTIFINNGLNPVNITIPNSFVSYENIEVGFVQQGTGLVTFVASGVTLKTPTGLKMKGQNYQAFVQKVGVTNVWHVLGNVIA